MGASDWSNTRLVEACRQGDQQAWNVLVDRYRNLIYSIPLRQGVSPEDAADIFQSVCLELFHELPRLRDAEALQAWLITVATHRSYRFLRRQAVHAGNVEIEEETEPAGLPPDLLAELEREQMVREAIAGLPPRCRQVIEMLFFEQPPVPYLEVARRLKLAAGSIGFIRGRCLKRLKRVLEEKGF